MKKIIIKHVKACIVIQEIQKFPAIHTGGPGTWRKYRNRKDITLDDFYRFEQLMKQAKYVGAEQTMHGRIVKFGSKETNPNISVIGVTMGAFKTNAVTISDGREINETDVQHSNDVCVLGDEVTQKLFPNINPVGLTVRVDGYPLKVIGTLEKQPEFFGQSMDNYIVIHLQHQYNHTLYTDYRADFLALYKHIPQ